MIRKSGLSHIPIIFGYILILVLTVAIGYAYYNEEHTLSLTDEKNRSANELRREINELNMHLTALSLMGETAMEWTDMERDRYHRQRLHIDSTLCEFSRIFISEATDIDSLRILLDDKLRTRKRNCSSLQKYTGVKRLSLTRWPTNCP